jgi:hypothetical protein
MINRGYGVFVAKSTRVAANVDVNARVELIALVAVASSVTGAARVMLGRSVG